MHAELELGLERRIGKRSAAVIEKHLGITTVGGLLNYFPRRYLSRGELTPISEVPLDEEVTLIARVVSNSTRPMRARRGSLTDVVISDDAGGAASTRAAGALPGTLKVSFFNGFRAKAELQPGRRAMFSGKVTRYAGSLGLTNPDFLLLDEDPETPGIDPEKLAAMPIPVYPATAKLTSWSIQKVISTLLDTVELETLGDPLPAEIAAREKFLPVADAYRLIHAPQTPADYQRARDRFRYQEALVLQSALARRRAQLAAEEATARRPAPDGLLPAFDRQLPFTLTAGQAAVGKTLSDELAQDSPMNRLLQGEVGSGKTIVALRAMLQVVDAGGQAALLAPTEVLAAQHYESIRRTLGPLSRDGMLGGFGPDAVQVTLLTGSMPTAARKQAMLDAASGTAGIVIGTHALLSDNVSFYDLGLIVVDEQHRFGVEQRDALRAKASKPPHLLVMTATPIPRTVAMTVFGDLETSVLDELPAGRAPISTHVVGLAEHPGWATRIWSRSREEIDAGHQVYVVCPKIGTDDDGDFTPGEAEPSAADLEGENGSRELASVTGVVEHLQDEPALAGVAVAPAARQAGPGAEVRDHGLLHGQPDQAAGLHHRDRSRRGRPQRHAHGDPGRGPFWHLPAPPAARQGGPRRAARNLPAGHHPGAGPSEPAPPGCRRRHHRRLRTVPGGPQAPQGGRHPGRLAVRRALHAEAAARARTRGRDRPGPAGRPADRGRRSRAGGPAPACGRDR